MASRTQTLARALDRLPGGRLALALASGGASRVRAPIFMLHRVLPNAASCYDPEMAVSLGGFERLLDWLQRQYQVRPLGEIAAGKRPAKGRPWCALTFDDGWVDTFEHAFPSLQRRGLPATVFLPMHFIGTERRFWQERLHFQLLALRSEPGRLERAQRTLEGVAWCADLRPEDWSYDRLRRRLLRRASAEAEAFVARLDTAAAPLPALEGRAFMNWDEVARMHAAGIEFGSHTLEHTRLDSAAPGEAARELLNARQELEQRLRQKVTPLSYPWGSTSVFTPLQAREAGYTCAVTTGPGLARPHADPYLLPRIPVSDAQLDWTSAPAPAALQVQMLRARREPRRAALVAAPVRIGLIVHDERPWSDQPVGHLGGSELQLRRALEALDPRYFEPEVYFMYAPAEGLPQRLPWPSFAAAAAAAPRVQMLRALRRLLRQRRPRLVQVTFPHEILWGTLAARWAGVPAILCARRNAGYWRKSRQLPLLRLANRFATYWQTNAASVAAQLEAEEQVPAARVDIIPNALDLDRFQPAGEGGRLAARRALHLPEEAYIAVNVANYSAWKRLDTAVEATALLRVRLPGVRMILIGEGAERGALASMIAQRGLEQHVLLAGARADVPLWLAAADAGVSCSSSEGCPNAVLEYMAAGLPTVLTDIAGHRGLANAPLYAVGDAAALARELAAAAADPAAARARGRELRARAEAYGGESYRMAVQRHYTRALLG
ncbi:MAG TPA: polysaccharide deacetylase family protein [Terriglobales bacterium]|nr:polysaccharide deacetylase family protein [Terriglobales bacterium]